MSTRNVSRRQFIRGAGSVVAVSPFIISGLSCAAGKPSERITLGFIGNGMQGRGLMGGFLNKKEVQVVAVCDVDTHRREAAKKQVEEHYGKHSSSTDSTGCRAYTDFRELLANKEIDAVVIATPDHWHAPIAIAAAKAGKDIYCEKPLCQSIHDARAMVNAVRENNRVFQTGSMQRSSEEFRTACELVRNGAIGKIKTVDVAVGGPGKWCDLPEESVEPGLNWDMWLGPAPKRPYNSILSPRGVHNHYPNWRLYREYGGGMVTDWGAHHFDIAQWGLGTDESGPSEIIPAAEQNAEHGVRLIYANGVEVNHIEGNGVTFHGSDGTIYVNRGQFEMTIGNKKLATSTKDLEKIAAEFLPENKTNLIRLYKSDDHKADWLSCMKTRKKPIADVEIGARSVSVCHLINLAYYHGQKMKWDPKTEKFLDSAGDPKWLDVPHREPWVV
ncbi:MAG TPA: Gfo/Idh/MocA family oxidoreductase [Candidatus Saccharimonadales bacterium]|nr:Gfo/Idh/MocA family oxidoreductase [Candidatus Saccharimonadales bacterium]